jgi:hypothetical protein
MIFINKLKIVAPLLGLIMIFGCNGSNTKTSDSSEGGTSEETTDEQASKLLTGFNINWSFLPELNNNIVAATATLQPKIIRYPGGTVSKTWQWKEGITTKHSNRTPHPLDDLVWIKEETDSKVIFVLNTISSDLENQLALLSAAQDRGIEIKHIEVGNEHYLGKGVNADDQGKHQDNVIAFPTGKEYAEFVNKWSEAILDKFPDAKIGISMLGKVKTNNQRLANWNKLIVEHINKDNFHAYVYHIYVHAEGDIALTADNMASIIKVRTDFLEEAIAMVGDDSKEKWFTEYGVHADTEEATVALTSLLADYVESIADISMPQVLYTKSDSTYFSLLTSPDADSLTELGTLFSTRAKKQ